MEPRGRKWWQTFDSLSALKRLEKGDYLVEGVNGSSPLEGFLWIPGSAGDLLLRAHLRAHRPSSMESIW